MPKVAATVPVPIISNYEELFGEHRESLAKLVRHYAKKNGIAFAPSETEWANIEASYGHKLTPDLRKHICDLTLVFLFFVGPEFAAATVSSARVDIEKIKRIAEKRGILLEQLMAPIIDACNGALAELDDPEKHGPRKGEIWNEWVWRIGAVLEKQELPTKVRKDEMSPGRTSPFVRLIRELQQAIPSEYRKGDHSTLALATAIVKGRAMHGRDAKGTRKPV